MWQPIETAPKDGTEILVWGKSGSWGPSYYVALWDGAWKAMIGGWQVYDDSQIEEDPTHWTLLPDPPR